MKQTKLTLIAFAAAVSLAGAAMAQQTNPNPPSGTMDHGQMMQGQGGSGAMPMMGMMQQMSQMMENCNKMMQSMMNQQGQSGSGQQPAPQGNRG